MSKGIAVYEIEAQITLNPRRSVLPQDEIQAQLRESGPMPTVSVLQMH
jgi:hypothetical protein